MTAAVMLGVGFGLGVLALVRGLKRSKPSLTAVLASLAHTDTQVSSPPVEQHPRGLAARAGRPFVPLLDGLGLPTAGTHRDLMTLDRPVHQHLAEKAAAALAGLMLPPAVTFALMLAGTAPPWPLPAWASLLAAGAGFVAPDLSVRARAAHRRANFRHSLAVYLDLVATGLAAGAGAEAALHYAAEAGTGWAFAELRRALDAARMTRRPPWETLGALGRRIQVEELTELASTLTLAGTEGAKVRSTLTAKAASLRARQLTEIETAAHAATERLSLPLVLLFAGFLILIGYPAIAHVLNGL